MTLTAALGGSPLDVEERLELVARPPTEEVVTTGELKALLETNSHPKHYIGLEISGLLHLGHLISAFKMQDFMGAGLRCTVFLADWHSYINNKFGGDWDKIRRAASYYEEAFKLLCPGVDVVLGSELYRGNDLYWSNLIRFCKEITLARDTRCLTIMGRSEREKLDFAQYLYPPMQAVDIKALDLDLVHAGIDQRKVHMLVRETFPRLGWKPPVAVHHHLLPGLDAPRRAGLDEDAAMDQVVSSKMSKSKPWTCIFVHDGPEEIRRKVRKAWCPEGEVAQNPVLQIAKHMVFHDARSFDVDRPAKYGGPLTFEDYASLEQMYGEKRIHPADLKEAVARELDGMISPVRKHFADRASLLEVYRD